MKIKKAHLLFEQSGTFKNEFRKLGITAEDYDIQNDFGETDYQLDLFAEIDKAFEGNKSIFDNFTPEDIIFAFYPCVRFEDQITIHFRGEMVTQNDWTLEQKCLYDIKLMEELSNLYIWVNKLFIVCMRKNLRLVMENPRGTLHFLNRYWCIKPTFIDADRRLNGDYYKKPTQYWFLNCSPEQNVIFEALPVNEFGITHAVERANKKYYEQVGAKDRKTMRSMIHPDYANRFIRQYILDSDAAYKS